jgi:hypothetical protein
METFSEYEKDLLGSDHYPVMTPPGRAALLDPDSLSAGFFGRVRSQEAGSALTCGDVRRMLQQEHRRNLLYWLEAHFLEGQSVDLICSQLAL